MDGLFGGVNRDQLEPSQLHVSLNAVPMSFVPPNNRTDAIAGSHAMAAESRAGEVVTGGRCVHFVRSQTQVSLRTCPTPIPPNRATRLLVASDVRDAPARAGGTDTGCSCNHFVPSQNHVSL